MSKKLLVSVVAVCLLVGGIVGGSFAFLLDKTQTVTNTFTIGDVNITLTETDTVKEDDGVNDKRNYKMVPGLELAKDPKVSVEADSEPSWVFVKVEEVNNPSTYLDYKINTVAEGGVWTALDGVDGVYYYDYSAISTTKVDLAVLLDDKVTVKNTVTKDDLDTINANKPQLKFSAYAIQKEGFTTAKAGWDEVSK